MSYFWVNSLSIFTIITINIHNYHYFWVCLILGGNPPVNRAKLTHDAPWSQGPPSPLHRPASRGDWRKWSTFCEVQKLGLNQYFIFVYTYMYTYIYTHMYKYIYISYIHNYMYIYIISIWYIYIYIHDPPMIVRL